MDPYVLRIEDSVVVHRELLILSYDALSHLFSC